MAENAFVPELEADLPVFPMDVFVGRGKEIRRSRDLLRRPAVQLLTVTGPAGVGKTRLALELARNADAWFGGNPIIVRLAAIRGASEIVPEVARSLGIVDQAERLELRVQRALANRPSLIVLDNLEHLLPEAIPVVEWLCRVSPAAKILTTSRRPLRSLGEERLELEPFASSAAVTVKRRFGRMG